MTHDAYLDGRAADSYESTWKAMLASLDRGERRAERVVLVTTCGESPSGDRMKVLPAIFYSGQVPGPVLALRIGIEAQRRILALFALYAKQASELGASVCSGVTVGRSSLRRLNKARSALREEFTRAIPTSYLEFLDTVRPKEVINFSVLPLEWLEVNHIPLGLLSKVTSMRSPDLASDFQAPVELATIYNSLITQGLNWMPSEFAALIIAPSYPGEDEINSFISAQAVRVEEALRSQARDEGREIRLETDATSSKEPLRRRLEQEWSLVIYIGHANNGALRLPDGYLRPRELDSQPLLGSTFILIGCDTQGAANVSGSVASQLLSQGARGVFATYYPLHIQMAQDFVVNLILYLVAENRRYGDVLALARYSSLWEQCFRCYFAGPGGRAVREKMAAEGRFLSAGPKNRKLISRFELTYSRYQDSWDLPFREVTEWWREQFIEGRIVPDESPDEDSRSLVDIGALGSLAWSFSGDLRARLFSW